MKPIRMYMNSYEEAIEFIERIRPVCSKVFIPSKTYWDNFSNKLGQQDMISTTINYKEPTIRIEIIKNEYKAESEDKE